MRNRAGQILNNQRGISLLIVLLLIVIMGLAAGIAGSSWRTIMQRERETELLFRGDQYRRAIKSYYEVAHGGQRGMLPSTLDDLVKDPRFPNTVRHLRKLYKDPMTGEDFEVIKDQTAAGRIKGVRSTSEDEPFKKDGFSKEDEKFSGATSYKQWEFVYEPAKTPTRPTSTIGLPGQTVPGGGQPIQGVQGGGSTIPGSSPTGESPLSEPPPIGPGGTQPSGSSPGQ